MDTKGARALDARIRAGALVGKRIALLADGVGDSGLVSGDCGVVLDVTPDGCVVVEFDRGVSRKIDPTLTPYRTLAA